MGTNTSSVSNKVFSMHCHNLISYPFSLSASIWSLLAAHVEESPRFRGKEIQDKEKIKKFMYPLLVDQTSQFKAKPPTTPPKLWGYRENTLEKALEYPGF